VDAGDGSGALVCAGAGGLVSVLAATVSGVGVRVGGTAEFGSIAGLWVDVDSGNKLRAIVCAETRGGVSVLAATADAGDELEVVG